jgi:phosphomannomutase|tara:strand:+ start:1906 stop:2667 length:762 start_codon:yes stop_codon:yes gene_type:complete
MSSTNKIKEIYIFDVDGTLTPSRQVINTNFASFFTEFASKNQVYIASGSDLEKIESQLPESILKTAHGVFTCMGNCFHQYGLKIYQNDFIEPPGLREDLKNKTLSSKYPKRFGNHIEERIGMINYSILGRSASQEDRKEYARFDKEHKERILFASVLNKKYQDQITAAVGGEISIDIINPGKDKSQVLTYLTTNDMIGPNTVINFFGDKTKPGGNDFALASAIENSKHKHNVFNIEKWQDTWKILLLEEHKHL